MKSYQCFTVVLTSLLATLTTIVLLFGLFPKHIEDHSLTMVNGLPAKNFTQLWYYGLGLSEQKNFFGRIPIGFIFPMYQIYPDIFSPDDGLFYVTLYRNNRGGFKGFYLNSNQLRFKGDGEFHFTTRIVSIAFMSVHNAKYYKRDGSLGSEIVNGHGIETIWSEDGKKIFESHYVDSKWQQFTIYDADEKEIFQRERNDNDF